MAWRTTLTSMNATDRIAVLFAIVLIVQNAAQIPAALTNLLQACLPTVRAARALAAEIKNPPASPTGYKGDDPQQPHGRDHPEQPPTASGRSHA